MSNGVDKRVGSFLFGHETGHSIARPIACGNRVPPQRTVLGETSDPLADVYPLVCTQYSPMLWPG